MRAQRRRSTATLGLLFIAGLAGMPSAFGQEPPRFSSAIDLVAIDAVVLDKDGQPVGGLTKDDFIIKEDGEVREILSFEAFQAPRVETPGFEPGREAPPDASPTPAPAPAAPSSPPAASRTFALFFDDVFIGRDLVDETRAAALAFLRGGTGPGDRVFVANTSGDLVVDARLPAGRASLESAIARFAGRDELGLAPGIFVNTLTFRNNALKLSNRTELNAMEAVRAGRARGGDYEIEHRRRDRVRRTARAVIAQMDRMAAIKGRKNLFFLSQGVLQDDGSELRAMAAAAREANVAVYFVDVRGIVATSQGAGDNTAALDPLTPNTGSVDHRAAPAAATLLAASGATREGESAGTADLARDTGGASIRNTNELARNMVRAADESRAYYLLGFAAGEGKAPGRWRKLDVRARRSGARVKARRGYTLQRPDLQASAAELVARAKAYTLEPVVGKQATRTVVAVEFDAAASDKRKAVRNLEFTISLRQRDTGRLLEDSGKAPVEVRADEAPAWRSFAREFQLPQGDFDVRVAVHDPASNAMGSGDTQVQVPPTAGLRLSTPILTDQVLKDGGTGKPRAAMGAHRAFRTGGSLYCEFEVFGAASSPASPSGQVEAGVQILDAAGVIVRNAPPTSIAADGNGRLVRFVGMEVADLAAGRYELLIKVRDRVASAGVEHREAFTLDRPSS